MKSRVMEEVQQTFKPEFLNRIDETIVFHPLTKENISEIVVIMMKTIEKRASEQMELTMQITDAAKEILIEKGYDEKYGARPLRRFIQQHIETTIAKEIIADKIPPHSVLVVDEINDQLSVTAQPKVTAE